MTHDEAVTLRDNNMPGPCPICGAESMTIIGVSNQGSETEAVSMIICCAGGQPKDGGVTFCGARLDKAVGPEGYIMQLMRWNRRLA